MSDELKSIQNYIHAIEKKLAMDDATEHTHRAALQALIESLLSGVSATNEPKHIDCGAPDFVIRKGVTTIGYIEAKDIGISLDNTEKSDQLKRYLNSLTNLILTDYLEFRWYVDGECRLKANLGTPAKEGKIKRDKDGIQAVAEVLTAFLEHQAENVGTPQGLADDNTLILDPATGTATFLYMVINEIRQAFAGLTSVSPQSKLDTYAFCTNGSESAGKRNIPTIGFGPGNPQQAHIDDEYIEIAQLLKASEGYAAIAREVLT